VNFLTECAATVEFLEFFDGRNHDAKQLEDSQQSQKPQCSQVNRNKGLQKERRDSQKVDDGKGTKNIGHARCYSSFWIFIFRRQVKAQCIFQNEHSD
jgi:hypothetical protein